MAQTTGQAVRLSSEGRFQRQEVKQSSLATPLTHTVMLTRLGSGMRGLYQDILDEPLPDFLAVFVRELEEREPERTQN